MNRLSDGSEWKYSDVGNVVTPSTLGDFHLMNGITLGSSAVTRIGRVITIKTAQINLVAINGTTTNPGVLRVMLFYDKQANANAPSTGPNDLLENTPLIVSARGLNQRTRYRILADRYISFGPSGAGDPSEYLRIFVRFRRGLRVQYNGGIAGTVADIVTNSLYMFLLSSTGTPCTVSFYTRVRFTDA